MYVDFVQGPIYLVYNCYYKHFLGNGVVRMDVLCGYS